MEPGHRRLLALLGVAVFFEGYGRSLPSVTLSYIGRDLAAPAPELSQALALIAAGALGVLVLGPLADALGRRPVLLGCILLYGLLGAATASASALRQLVAWQAAARMFQEGALYVAAIAAAEEMPAARRGTAQGLLGAANTLGSGLVALLFATVERWPGGWRGLCLVSLAPLATLPFLGRRIPESRRWLERSPRTPARLPPAYRARMLAALAVVFLGTSYDVAGFAFTAYLPMTAHGWSPLATSAMIVGAGGLGLPGWWVGGRLADRAGRRRTAILFLLGLTLAEVTFFLGGTRVLWPAFGAMVFCAAGKTTVLRAWATELFPTSVRGTAAGWLSAGATLGGMAGLGVAGALAPALGGIEASLALVAGAGVAAAAAASAWLPETSGLELEAIAPEPT